MVNWSEICHKFKKGQKKEVFKSIIKSALDKDCLRSLNESINPIYMCDIKKESDIKSTSLNRFIIKTILLLAAIILFALFFDSNVMEVLSTII